MERTFLDKAQREVLEDLLEAVWLRREAGRSFSLSRFKATRRRVSVAELAGRLQREGLIRLAGDRVELTEAGDRAAAKVVRRHRLAERLFCDLLRTGSEESNSLACRFEHILNEEVTEAVCTLLGHPPTCPHGREIPPGPCCRGNSHEVESLVRPLGTLKPGDQARIVFLTPRFHQRLDRLNSFGVVPGSVIQVHQKEPVFVLRIDATEVAIEKEIAHEIFVIRLD